MSDLGRIPFYDLETAAKALAEIFINYDLAEFFGDFDDNDDPFNLILADKHIANTAAHDILHWLAAQESK